MRDRARFAPLFYKVLHVRGPAQSIVAVLRTINDSEGRLRKYRCSKYLTNFEIKHAVSMIRLHNL